MGSVEPGERGDRRRDPTGDRAVSRGSGTRRRRVLIGVAVVLAMWAVIAGSLLLGARGALERAEQLLPIARDAVSAGDVELATGALESAREELTSASSSLNNPLVRPLRAVPVLGADLRTITAVADSGAAVGDAAAEVVATLESLPGGLDALKPADGAFPVAAIEALAPSLRRTADAAADALRRLEDTPDAGTVARVYEARQRVLEVLAPVATQAETAAQLTAQLPAFLGADGPRTYLFGASTPAELRGAGGFIGSVSIMRFDDGRPDFGAFRAASDLPTLPPDALPAPEPLNPQRWARYGGTGDWPMLARTPHFPAAAGLMTQHWTETTGQAVDGMFVADPFALEALLRLSGPAEVPGYGVTMDADSVVAFVTNEAYTVFEDPDERKELLGAVAASAVKRFLQGGSDDLVPADLIRTLSGLVTGGHVLVFAEDADLQQALSRAGFAGEFGDPDGDLVNVVLNNGAANKIDFYAQRSIDHEVTLLRDGATSSRMTVTVSNEAPTSGASSYVIGPNNPTLDAGDNLTNISVYLAMGASFTEVPEAAADLPTFTEVELGHPVHDGWVRIPSGVSVERRYRWRTPDAWRLDDDGTVVYDLLFQGQTVIRATHVTLRVNIPAGFEVMEVPDGAVVEDGALVWSGLVGGEDVDLKVRLLPSRDS